MTIVDMTVIEMDILNWVCQEVFVNKKEQRDVSFTVNRIGQGHTCDKILQFLHIQLFLQEFRYSLNYFFYTCTICATNARYSLTISTQASFCLKQKNIT